MASTGRGNRGRRLRLAVAGAAVATVLTAACAAASPATAMEVQAPDAGPSRDPSTPRPVPGFVLERGRYTPVAIPPHLAATAPKGISPMGINDHGQLVGEYQDQDGVDHGFLLQRGDRFTRIDVPGAVGTSALDINNRGQVTGVTGEPTAPDGFLLDRGRFTTFDAPGATITFAAGLDDRGQVVGFSTSDLTGASLSGFLRDAGGRFTAINRPGNSITLVFDSNNRGQLVGVAGNPEDLAGAEGRMA